MSKFKQTLAIWGTLAALCLSAGSLMAQNNGGPGGGRGRFRNFDPAQFRQRIMDNIRDRLGFTNDTDWNAVQPLVQKVMDARRDVGGGLDMRMMFRRRGGDNGNRSRRFGPPLSPQAQALRQAIDDNAPDAQVKAALEKYQASQKEKLARLTEAQDNLRKVLSIKQEAEATLMGLLQ